MILFASYSMIKNKSLEPNSVDFTFNRMQLIIVGLLVGFITGIIGVGVGFLIIPVLTNWAKLSVKTAVATSLIILTINSLFVFMVDHDGLQQIDWMHISIFSLIAIIGIMMGIRMYTKIPGEKLKSFLDGLFLHGNFDFILRII